MIPRIFNISIFLILLCRTVIGESNDYKCSKNSRDYKCSLTSKTPYRFLSNNDDTIKITGCKAEKIWMIIRHGTRFPTAGGMKKLKILPQLQEEILAQCEKKECHLSKTVIESLENWKVEFKDDDMNLLAKEGENELFHLAKRFQSRYPDLMARKYDTETFKFKYTTKQRTRASAEYFTRGLFGSDYDQVQFPIPDKKDPVLGFSKNCNEWKQEVDNNPIFHEQIDRFKNSSIVLGMLHQLSTRLGINATFETAKTIKDICAFETAWKEKNESTWCKLLTLEDFKILEFYHDLKSYWNYGYGHSLNYEQACPVITDMFDFFYNNNSNSKVSLYFSHSDALIKIISFLGIAKDNFPLLYDSYSTAEDRNWRISLIGPFATNLAFIYYDCSTIPGILVMHQERIVNFPGCPKDLPCPLEMIQKLFPHTFNECHYNELCGIVGEKKLLSLSKNESNFCVNKLSI